VLLHTYRKLAAIFAGFLLGACTTHYYYPMNASATVQGERDFSKFKLQGTSIDLRCKWKDRSGEVSEASSLCRHLTKLFTAEKASIATFNENEDNEEIKKVGLSTDILRVRVDGQSLATRYSSFDHALFWLTFGFYPADTDRWQSVNIRVLDKDGEVLQQGQFKAMMRTYYGWGYWTANRVMGWIKKPDQERCCKNNSIDFYQFISQLVYDARMEQRVEAEAKPQTEKKEP
jgi:hypothetical protein